MIELSYRISRASCIRLDVITWEVSNRSVYISSKYETFSDTVDPPGLPPSPRSGGRSQEGTQGSDQGARHNLTILDPDQITDLDSRSLMMDGSKVASPRRIDLERKDKGPIQDTISGGSKGSWKEIMNGIDMVQESPSEEVTGGLEVNKKVGNSKEGSKSMIKVDDKKVEEAVEKRNEWSEVTPGKASRSPGRRKLEFGSLAVSAIWRERNSGGEHAQTAACLTARLDRMVRNRVTSLRRKNGGKYERAMDVWFDAKAPHLSSTLSPFLPWKFNKHVQPNKGLTRQGNGNSEELRCVIAVIRHGDRTPKQKVNLNVTEEKLLNLMLKYNGEKPRAETKLKSAVQLQDLLDATRMLVPHAKAPHLSLTLPPTLPWKFNKHVQPNKGLTRQGNGNSEELRCVIAVIRHGDRTPKQMVNLNVTEEKLLNLMLKYNGGKPRAEVREAPAFLAVELQDLLDATRMLVPRTRPGRESDSDPEDLEHAEKLRQVKAVIEESGKSHFQSSQKT
ncbi:LOW QUALITY PROTEIN: hypothetical protein HID58_028892 [Brassica napus]|uniref:Inositol hexakisphosphate and diphosphoinositol-pentakisphosphate kinase n=1 Tax=Brassica napus TaxID=3708 RepID=A0ABQ8CBJ9_BRANA|nr:LOW QUALITY PROTEIN: hypothetical protein HID58_028892 [Brassica napus]